MGSAFLRELSLAYQRQLLTPDDWFTFWRLNCAVTALHDHTLKEKVKADYEMESKWDFLVRAAEKKVAVSPCVGLGKLAKLGLELGAEIVAKDKNCEGGMGIHFLKNACHGGDWILQPRLQNSKALDELLPKNAPLSTMRVLTASCAGMPEDSAWRRTREEITPFDSGLPSWAGRGTDRPQCDLLQCRYELGANHPRRQQRSLVRGRPQKSDLGEEVWCLDEAGRFPWRGFHEEACGPRGSSRHRSGFGGEANPPA